MAPPPSLLRCAIAEFVGTLLFQLLGGSATYAPFNGVILAIIIFMTAECSGGVVNPAVATVLLVLGELSSLKWLVYVIIEILGAVVGAFIAAAADPTAPSLKAWALDNELGVGCVPNPKFELTFLCPIFIWEAAGTFMLCATVLATAVAKPGFGHLAPMAIGLSVAVNVGSSGHITGGCYNPARFLGPAIVYGCGLHLTWLYLSAQLFGALVAALWHAKVTAPRAQTEDAVTLSGAEMMNSSSTIHLEGAVY